MCIFLCTCTKEWCSMLSLRIDTQQRYASQCRGSIFTMRNRQNQVSAQPKAWPKISTKLLIGVDERSKAFEHDAAPFIPLSPPIFPIRIRIHKSLFCTRRCVYVPGETAYPKPIQSHRTCLRLSPERLHNAQYRLKRDQISKYLRAKSK